MKPHECPVCRGRGTVEHGFYGDKKSVERTASGQEVCRSCGGTGVVWEPVPRTYDTYNPPRWEAVS